LLVGQLTYALFHPAVKGVIARAAVCLDRGHYRQTLPTAPFPALPDRDDLEVI